MHIECKRCSSQLTPDLNWVDPRERNLEMGSHMVERSKITVEDGAYFHNQSGVYITNADDEMNMYLTSDAKRIAGCCGLDGCDGPNLFCKGCASYVATKMTDCWMPHCIVFDPNATREVPTSAAHQSTHRNTEVL